MNILSCQLGFGNEVKDNISLNIYFSGCKNNKKCNMSLCHNQECRDFNSGSNYTLWYDFIKKLVECDVVQCFCLLGGEPLDQDAIELLNFVDTLTHYSLPIYIYTGYDYNHIPFSKYANFLKKCFGIYYGHFDPDKDNKKYKKL